MPLLHAHHVKIEKRGYGGGVIINGNFLGEWYKYRISTSGKEIRLQVREIDEAG